MIIKNLIFQIRVLESDPADTQYYTNSLHQQEYVLRALPDLIGKKRLIQDKILDKNYMQCINNFFQKRNLMNCG